MSRRPSFLIRDFRATVLTGADRVIFVGAGGATITVATDRPADWSSTWQRLASPVERRSLERPPAGGMAVDAALLARLVDAGHLMEADSAQALRDRHASCHVTAPGLHLERMHQACEHLLLGCCGSVVSGLMAPTLLSLQHAGFQRQFDVILTTTAARFLSRDLLESYGVRCWMDPFERQDGIRVPHVALGRTADLIVVCPATAACLARVATSACSDLLSLCIAASAAPVLLVPAMNTEMWNDTGVQRHVDALRASGRYVLEPGTIFGAADFGGDAAPMYGGHGTLWGGPLSFMHAAAAVLEARTRVAPPAAC